MLAGVAALAQVHLLILTSLKIALRETIWVELLPSEELSNDEPFNDLIQAVNYEGIR